VTHGSQEAPPAPSGFDAGPQGPTHLVGARPAMSGRDRVGAYISAAKRIVTREPTEREITDAHDWRSRR